MMETGVLPAKTRTAARAAAVLFLVGACTPASSETVDALGVSSDSSTGTAVDEDTTGTTFEQGSSEDSSTGSSTGGSDEGESSSSESGEEPWPVGVGCEEAPACDRGAYEGTLFVTDAEGMQVIAGHTSITGNIVIEETEAVCLRFLSCLETAHGVYIRRNEQLETLRGLDNLQESTFGFVVDHNPALVDTSGVSALRTVGNGNLTFFSNDALEELTGFESLETVFGNVIISENASLVEFFNDTATTEIYTYPNPKAGSPGQPPTLGGSLTIGANERLESVTGFGGLVVIYKNLAIRFNTVLTSLVGLHELQAIGAALIITNNPELCMSEAWYVGGDLVEGPLDLENSSTANNKDC